ncbi:HU family DNA-binding protein [Bacteroides sp. 224]|uniref:HU family DNA-binding protein n=1 Tax=Bacteroides sp. 224 TaxID=2302936 RepID=UPI0013D6025E|nr:HU family DNA-binding protein [Bacteroides sp. 224]NDV66707.1 DNA-binding protein [Bacteroides sp. 224]
MSLKYSIAELKNPLRPQAPKKFYARSQVREDVDIYRLAREIAYSSSQTEGDVLSTIFSLFQKTSEHLADGDSVSLGDFGKFQYHISSNGTATKEEFSTGHIRDVKLRFRPGRMIRTSVADHTFERVLSVKARKAAKVNG